MFQKKKKRCGSPKKSTRGSRTIGESEKTWINTEGTWAEESTTAMASIAACPCPAVMVESISIFNSSRFYHPCGLAEHHGMVDCTPPNSELVRMGFN